MENKELRQKIVDRIHLESELAELRQQIFSKERQIKKFTNNVEAAQVNLDDLSGSAMKRFFLGILGKREERIEEEQRLLREANSALLSAEYELTSMKEHVEDIQAQFLALESSVQEYVNELEVIGDVQMKKNLLIIIRMPDICYQIRDRIRKIKPLLAKAENVYSYGGLQTNHAIRSHNNRDAAMREHGKMVQDVLDELIALLTTYNQIAPEKFHLDFYKDWMDSVDFWESYPIAEASLDRIKKVEKWFYRVEGPWQNMQNELNEEMNIIREAVLEYLI